MEPKFEDIIRQDLHQFLLSMKEVDERLPECPDVEEKWEAIAKAYIPDGIKEFNDYPTASLGWMMYIGMAVAKYWNAEWEVMEQREQSQACLDFAESRQNSTEGQIYSKIENIEPGTKEAFNAYVSCLHQLYLMGVSMQLKRMGYHMTKMNW